MKCLKSVKIGLMRLIIFAILVLITSYAVAQDERFMREIFGARLKKYLNQEKERKDHKWQVFSPLYRLDVDQDGRDEGFVLEKRDGTNWLHVLDKERNVTGSFELDTMGDGSKVYKISTQFLDKKTRIAIVYFYEGKNDYISFFGSVRLYFVTFDNLNVKKPTFFKGPVIWEEFDNGVRHYHRKKYEVALLDLDTDGRKEIMVKYHRMSSVFIYRGNGQWLGNF